MEDYFKPLIIGKNVSEPFTDAVMNPIPLLSRKKIAEFKKIGIEIDGISLKITEVFFSNMKLYVDDNKDKYIKGFDYKSEMQETPFDVWFYVKYDPRRNANFETFARMFFGRHFTGCERLCCRIGEQYTKIRKPLESEGFSVILQGR